jgi:predicted transcriptional regulator
MGTYIFASIGAITVPKIPNSSTRRNSENSGANIMAPENSGCMPTEEREDAILQFFVEHGIPLPPKALYRGLKVQQNVTFSYRTVQNILGRLNDEGMVVRCDKEALDDGRIEPVPEGENGRRTYYFITEEGRKRLGAN